VSGAGEQLFEVPRVPASASALLVDGRGRLLILKPTYKRNWTLPGGQLEPDGETPWQACRREVREECGIEVATGRLACVDYRPPKAPGRAGGLRFLFDCGVVSDEQQARITLQAEEISAYRFAELDEAVELLSGPLRRRVLAVRGAECCLYLEDGSPVEGVRVTARKSDASMTA
jgi:ADP-ribose pyrophosphatase YjhB (NUDIX family)